MLGSISKNYGANIRAFFGCTKWGNSANNLRGYIAAFLKFLLHFLDFQSIFATLTISALMSEKRML